MKLLSKKNQNNLKKILLRKISKWASTCKKELTIEKIVEKKETNSICCLIEKREIDYMFHNLEIWTNSQLDFIKLYANVLIHYYNQQ